MIGVHYIVLYFFAIRYKQIDTIFHISQPDLGNRRGNPLRLPRACCFSHKGLGYRRGKSLAVAPRACCFSHKGFGYRRGNPLRLPRACCFSHKGLDYRRGKSLAVAPRACCFSHKGLGYRRGNPLRLPRASAVSPIPSWATARVAPTVISIFYLCSHYVLGNRKGCPYSPFPSKISTAPCN
jgi:hypothetical protein